MPTTSSLELSSINTESSSALALLASRVAIEERALDVRAINLDGLTDVADCFVIASGTSDRHCKNIAEKIKLALKEVGEQPISSSLSNREKSEWIVLDYGNIVIHVFYEPTRQFYKLDELWKEANELSFDDETEELAKKLRTGIYSVYS